MKIPLLFAMLAAPLLVFAAPTDKIQRANTAREECSVHSQAEMRDCLAKKAEGSALALRLTEQAALGAISQWDEDTRFIVAAQTRLNAANKAFAQYRQTQCAFTSALGGGAIGNALDMLRFACETELNERRGAQLRNAAAQLPPKQ